MSEQPTTKLTAIQQRDARETDLGDIRTVLDAMSPGTYSYGETKTDGTHEGMVEAFRHSVDVSPGDTLWAVWVDQGEDYKCVGYTGNGPTSEANARGLSTLAIIGRSLLDERDMLLRDRRWLLGVVEKLRTRLGYFADCANALTSDVPDHESVRVLMFQCRLAKHALDLLTAPNDDGGQGEAQTP